MRYVTTVEEKTFVIEIENEGEITVDGQIHSVDMRRIEPLSLYSLLVDHVSHEAFIEEREGELCVVLQGKLYTVQVQERRVWERTAPRAAPPTTGGELLIEAPLPGAVVEVLVTAGQEVRAGETLLVLESMKMETSLSCPRDGVVRAVHVAARDHVGQGQVLVTVST